MNILTHINYRIWTLWTPEYWWDSWTPEACAAKLPLFTSPIVVKGIAYRICYLAGLGTSPYSVTNGWTMDLYFAMDDWLKRQTS